MFCKNKKEIPCEIAKNTLPLQRKTNKNMTEKVRVSQDFLFEYLKGHDVNLKTLAELMGTSSGLVYDCFLHRLDRYGNPRVFTKVALPKLNAALPLLAAHLREHVIAYGTSEMFTNRYGRIYDPGTVPAFKALSKYFSLTSLCHRVLGWSGGKKMSIFCVPSSKVYGNITAEDVSRINAELLAVAGMLDGIEVEPAYL